jgi:hypothetical protein
VTDQQARACSSRRLCWLRAGFGFLDGLDDGFPRPLLRFLQRDEASIGGIPCTFALHMKILLIACPESGSCHDRLDR